MSVGVLTGRPAEEMPGSTGDLLPELLQLHEHVRQAMSGVVQALWPSVSLPVGDITTRCEPAYLGRVNFISSIKVIKQMKAQGL